MSVFNPGRIGYATPEEVDRFDARQEARWEKERVEEWYWDARRNHWRVWRLASRALGLIVVVAAIHALAVGSLGPFFPLLGLWLLVCVIAEKARSPVSEGERAAHIREAATRPIK